MSNSAKNLAYEAKEPAFLQRLRGQYAGSSGGLERPVSQRPRRPRDDTDDDGPTYVDAESHEVVSKEDYEAMVNGGDDRPAENEGKDQEKSGTEFTADGAAEAKKAATASKKNLAEIGGPRKRKQAKVVTDEVQEAQSNGTRPKDTGPRKPMQDKKKKKKIKLSFEE
ncbi:hypothetical protein BJY01DRAFT_219746 [Aspergillus pseudoustus]|uniref:DUF4604 domain-containing protein n=1 Tax=Aspergillus pseudoustus TaxID=1810923 RepID=A0ABR4JFS2_9EURO